MAVAVVDSALGSSADSSGDITTSGTDPCLVVFIGADGTGVPGATGVTFNGDALTNYTPCDTTGTGQGIEAWQRTPPDLTTTNAAASGGDGSWALGALALTGVDQTTPLTDGDVSESAGDTARSITIANVTANDATVGLIVLNGVGTGFTLDTGTELAASFSSAQWSVYLVYRLGNGSIGASNWGITRCSISACRVASASTGTTIAVPSGSATLTGAAAALALAMAVPAGALTLTGTTPTIGAAVSVPAGTTTLTGYAPTLSVVGGDVAIAVPAGTATLTGTAPALGLGLSVPAGTATLTGTTPTLGLALSVPSGTLTLTGTSPDSVFPGPDVGVLTLTGYAPTVSVAGGAVSIAVPAGAATLTGTTPALGLTMAVPDGALTLTGTTQTLGLALSVPAGSLTLTGTMPEVVPSGAVAVPSGTLTLTGAAPTFAFTMAVPAGTATLTGEAPGLGLSLALSDGSLTMSGLAPTLLVTGDDPPESAVVIEVCADVDTIEVQP